MKIPDKKKPTKQPANNVYFIKKIKVPRVRNGQMEFLIIWPNFPHSDSTWEPKENIFHEQNIKSFSKWNHKREPNTLKILVTLFNFGNNMIKVQKYLEFGKYLEIP